MEDRRQTEQAEDETGSKGSKELKLSETGSSYLATCSKVTRDAYVRVMEELQRSQALDRRTQETLSSLLQTQEAEEKQRRDRKQQEQKATKMVLEMQMQLKKERTQADKKKEQLDYAQGIANLPEHIATVYPRIEATSEEERKSLKARQQEDLKTKLKEQIAAKAQQAAEKERSRLAEEQALLQRLHEEEMREKEQSKALTQEKLTQYKEALTNNIHCKTVRKMNDEWLVSLEHEGSAELNKFSVPQASESPQMPNPALTAQEDEEAPQQRMPATEEQAKVKVKAQAKAKAQKAETEIEPEQEQEQEQERKLEGEHKIDKLAAILERKQQKAQELLRKAGAEGRSGKFSIEKLKSALGGTGFKMKSEGKVLRLSNGEVVQVLERAKAEDAKSQASQAKSRQSLNRHKSEGQLEAEAGSSIESVAYKRYLTQLEKQATQEHKRILDSLNREHAALLQAQQKESLLKQQRELYRHSILDEIARKRAQRALALEKARELPDIAGNQGYPPIAEATSAQHKKTTVLSYKRQQEDWIKQIQEKQAKLKNERDAALGKEKELLHRANEEEKQAQTLHHVQKKANQKLWKEVWDMESEVRQLKKAADHRAKPPAVVTLSPLQLDALPVLHPSGKFTSRHGSIPPLSDRHTKDKFFVTAEPTEDLPIKSQQRKSSSVNKGEGDGKYPWEKRERSREQYRNITLQQSS